MSGKNKRPVDNEYIEICYYDFGKSLREIARLVGMSHVAVGKRLGKLGLPRRLYKKKSRTKHFSVGKRFGNFLILSRYSDYYPARWVCRCAFCGGTAYLTTAEILKKQFCDHCRKSRLVSKK